MTTKPRYAVFGNPIAHSKSPQIHQQFAAQEGVQIEYERILAAPGAFAEAAAYFFAEGGQGANVTLPFKTDAYGWVDEHSERARAAGAVNTVVPLGGGRFLGDNTDGAGEILLTSMDRDGTKTGFNLPLTRAVSEAVDIPVIASGGVGNVQHLIEGVKEGKADAVLAASIFHFGEVGIREAKEAMRLAGIEVRL